MPKIDLKSEHKDLYAPPAGRFTEVEVPAMSFLAIDGKGDPNTSEDYREAVEALFAVSYAAKFISKRQLDRDYVVLPLEGLWSAEDPNAFVRRDKQSWSWTAMIRQPDWISGAMIEQAQLSAQKKRLPALSILRHETIEEGRSVQTLHVGSYDDEGPVLEKLHSSYLPDNGLATTGRHHEIYLNDPRKTDPAELKVILRQPVTARAHRAR
jgi:hypothetical protein